MELMKMSSAGYRFFVENIIKNFTNYSEFQLFFENKSFYGISKQIHFKIDLSYDCDGISIIKKFGIVLNKTVYENMNLIGKTQSLVKFILNENSSITVTDDSSKCVIDQYPYIKIDNLMFADEYDVNDIVASRVLDKDFVKKNAKILMKKENKIPMSEIYAKIANDDKLDLIGIGNKGVKKSFDIILKNQLDEIDYDYVIYTNSLGLTKYKEIEIYFHRLKNVVDPKKEPVYLLKTIQKITDNTSAEVLEIVLDKKAVKKT